MLRSTLQKSKTPEKQSNRKKLGKTKNLSISSSQLKSKGSAALMEQTKSALVKQVQERKKSVGAPGKPDRKRF